MDWQGEPAKAVRTILCLSGSLLPSLRAIGVSQGEATSVPVSCADGAPRLLRLSLRSMARATTGWAADVIHLSWRTTPGSWPFRDQPVLKGYFADSSTKLYSSPVTREALGLLEESMTNAVFFSATCETRKPYGMSAAWVHALVDLWAAMPALTRSHTG